MRINRVWSMPNKNTFSIPEIKNFIEQELPKGETIDPFARNSNLAKITNDLDPETTAQNHLEAIDFLRRFKTQSIDGVLFDPPYSPRQVAESYKKLGKTVNMETTQASFWSLLKKEISRVTKPKGKVLLSDGIHQE